MSHPYDDVIDSLIKPIAEEIEKKIKNFDPDGFKNTN